MIAIGSRFGRLEVRGQASRTSPNGSKRRYYSCACDCGGETAAPAYALTSGNTTSCGCFHREMVGNQFRKHGEASNGGERSPEYKVWAGMRSRCQNPSGKSFKNYGARGIGVCFRWDTSFTTFLADMGRKPSSTSTIERVDNEKGYEPGNCIWAEPTAQIRNRRSTRRIDYQGRNMPLAEACELAGMKYDTVIMRLWRGWPPERALTHRGQNG